MTWTPESWQRCVAQQHVHYPSQDTLKRVKKELAQLPPLVTHYEAIQLKKQLANVAEGNAFLLQGGDCAESFNDCRHTVILDKVKIILQMSLVLIHGLRKPIVRVGRIAGQYAKPRSADTETQEGVTLPSYRGDLINSIEFTEAARIPDPLRLLDAYRYSALTLNYIRALANGGFADLHHPEQWNLSFAAHSQHSARYHEIAHAVRDALNFLGTIPGANGIFLGGVDFYTSHEALHLHYEEALTHQNEHGDWYNLGAHFPWVGMRTSGVEGAHLHYLKGISNPIAVKISTQVNTDQIQELVHLLNPKNELGRLTLIHRFGAQAIEQHLPALIEAVQRTGISVVWSCDPMHGNTIATEQGFKTRRFESILSELEHAFQIHHALGSYLGGVHFEMTGEDVTECMGGARGLKELDLDRAYTSLCDPRLNYEQALEVAMRIVEMQKTNP